MFVSIRSNLAHHITQVGSKLTAFVGFRISHTTDYGTIVYAWTLADGNDRTPVSVYLFGFLTKSMPRGYFVLTIVLRSSQFS